MENPENIRDILLLLAPIMSGLIISHVTDLLKDLGVWRLLRDEDKQQVHDFVPRFITILLSLGMAWGSTLIPWIDAGVTTTVLLGSYPAAQGWHELRARRKG